MDTVSNFLSLITVWEIGVREAERKKTQTSEKDENTSKPCFKNEKIKIAKSEHTTLYSFNPAPYSGQPVERRHFGEVRSVCSAFRASRVF